MSHISKPVDWEVFNAPSIQPVQYYSILKKKRELSHLIKQHDTQVSRQECLHYCRIVPKNISSAFNSKYEIVIVFFDRTSTTSFIGFRVKVSKETFMHESNSLILFLKNSKIATFYLMSNNYIHVECGSNAWELFYLLYHDYLRKYVLTTIGTQFFCNFVYLHCIQREIQLLEALYKGSKIIRISKNSIYYKIHGKRKISVTDLIHMTLNMPKCKRYVISGFSSKESLLYPDLIDDNLYTSTGSKISVSKLALKKYKRELQLYESRGKSSITFQKKSSNSVFYPYSESTISKSKTNKLDIKSSSMYATLKRKFDEVGNENPEFKPFTSKILKISDSVSINEHQDEWKQYQNLNPFVIKCYSGISCINELVPNFLNEASEFRNPSVMNSDCDVSVLQSIKQNENAINVPVLGLFKEINNFNAPNSTNKTEDVISENTSLVQFKKPLNILTCADSTVPKSIFYNTRNSDKNYESHAGQDISIAGKSSTPQKDNQSHLSLMKDAEFTTATGKVINISDTAMICANKVIQEAITVENQEALHERDPNKTCQKPSFKSNYLDFKKSGSEHVPLAKISINKPSHNLKIFKDNEKPLTFETVLSPKVDENFRLDNLSTLEDVNFATAAGKTIQVSNTSMQAAHKLIQGVFNEENKPTSSKSIGLDKKYKNVNPCFQDIGCSSKISVDEDLDVEMDNALVEKFFEDTLFDEKEFESAAIYNTDENSNLATISKTDKNLPSRKPRKSLGGRRSMRYCSPKL